jgi:hypothetical protein
MSAAMMPRCQSRFSLPAFGLPWTLPAVTLNVDLSTLSVATDVAIGYGDPMQEIADPIRLGYGPFLLVDHH